jgi:hypothetical protein
LLKSGIIPVLRIVGKVFFIILVGLLRSFNDRFRRHMTDSGLPIQDRYYCRIPAANTMPPASLTDRAGGFSHRSARTCPATSIANPFVDCLDAMGYNLLHVILHKPCDISLHAAVQTSLLKHNY